MFFGHNLGHALLQESLVCVEHMSDNYVIISSLWQDRSCGSTWQVIVCLFLWLGHIHINYGSATVLNMAAKWKEFMREEMAWTPPELGWEAPGGKNSARDDGSPSHTIRQRKHFTFLNCSTGWQIISESTVGRDHCNVTHWSMCVESFINTSNQRYREIIYIWYKVDSGWEVVCRAMIWQNINKLTKKFLLN